MIQYSPRSQIATGAEYWMPAFASMTAVRRSTLNYISATRRPGTQDHALPDRRIGGLQRRRDAECHHQRAHGAAMGDGHRVDQ